MKFFREITRPKNMLSRQEYLFSPSKYSLIIVLNRIFKSSVLPASNTAHRLLVPGKGKYDDASLASDNLYPSDSSLPEEDSIENHFPIKRFALCNENRGLEELCFSSQSLQSMFNDGLLYIHDLVNIFLQNPSQFHRILVKRYHVPAKQAILTSQIMQHWWTNVNQ